MEKGENSIVLTVVLCVALVAGNGWVATHVYGILNYLVLWPLAFILCVWIAARFFRGHGSL